jgi:thioredoxin reductase (NADPH)
MEKLIILGTGCAGLTAAIYAGRANLSPLVIEGILPGGQLTTTSEVENFPGFPEGIDGYELMQRLRKQAARFGARFVSDNITKADLSDKEKKLIGSSGTYSSQALIIATGAAPKLTGIPGEKEMYGGKGVTTCATCDGAFYRDMEVVVIGGGDSACEEALFLTHFASKITLIHRRDTLRASKIMVERTVNHPKIKMLWNHVPKIILPDDKGMVTGIEVEDVNTHAKQTIACKGIFVAIGHTPSTEAFKGILPMDDQGYLISEKPSQVKMNIPGVFTAGDCADHIYRQAITAAGMGCQAAIDSERWLAAL